jgi:polysaccharide biosynthesis protein PslH
MTAPSDDSLSLISVTSELPWPLNTGGKLRTFHIQNALQAAFSNSQLIVPTMSDTTADEATLREQGIAVQTVPVSRRTWFSEVRRFVRSRMSGTPYAMYGRHRHTALHDHLRGLPAHPRRVAWLDHIDSLQYAPRFGQTAKSIIDLHNVYSLILERLADEQSSRVKSWLFRTEATRMRRMERRAARQCDAILAVSAAEADYYRDLGAKPVHVVPNGVDCAAFAHLPSGREADSLNILFVGTLSWGPNVGAALALANDIFPAVRAQLPSATLAIVGKDPAAEIRQLSERPGITVAGNVPSMTPYLAAAALLAVPLDSGGGTRLKILEAFAAGLPVVSTAVGAEGIDARPDHDIVIAERSEMAAAIVALARQPDRMTMLARNARALAIARYDWSAIGEQCVRIVRGIIE